MSMANYSILFVVDLVASNKPLHFGKLESLYAMFL